jgi:F-type H+-transporting ATPase subunit a
LTEQAASEVVNPAPEATQPKPRRLAPRIIGLIAAVVILDLLAVIFVPPFPKGGTQGDACAFPVCFIAGTLEFPPPHVVVDLDPANPLPSGAVVVGFHPSITSTILTMWIVTALVLIVVIVATRGMRLIPRRLQNVIEFAYEALSGFATSLGGVAAQPYIPLFAALFLYILFSNWSGLVPPVGKVEELRAPTSDVNITIGLALVSFLIFEIEGFRKNGILGYLSKFFPVTEFRKGIGAGILGMYVGLIELLLEFIKPLTLSMRLFGNIYGGEVALGVITALTLAVLPVAVLGLEVLLNFIQALIFSVLTLMFTIIAIEGPGHDEAGHAEAGHAEEPHGAPSAPTAAAGQPAS